MERNSSPKVGCPPVGFDTLTWTPRARQLHSRAELKRQTGSYQASVPASIAQWTPELSAADSADIEDATRRLVEFDHHANATLTSGNAAFPPMVAILLRTESASSSQIEQLTASAGQIALAEISRSDRSNAQTIVGNVRAMEAALTIGDAISEQTVLDIHQALMSHQQGFNPSEAGSYRREQVWIGAGVAGPRGADFVPPHHDRIAEAMSDLMRFIERDDLPVLVQAATAHAQFETIHPFVDGNGRTGRALVHSILRLKEVITHTAVPLSAGLLAALDGYFDALGSFRNGDAGPIIRQFAQAARSAAKSGTQLVDDLLAALELGRLQLEGVRSDAAAWRALPLFTGQPIVDLSYLTRTLDIPEMSALRALRTLVERGVIEEVTGRQRGRLWKHPGILQVLDDYAQGVRRKPVR